MIVVSGASCCRSQVGILPIFLTMIILLSTGLILADDSGKVAETVCVTGATGYLGMELTAQLLKRGFHVRGSVRDPNRKDRIAPLLALPFAKERLKIVQADLLKGESSFGECMRGASVLYHTASPFATKGINDPMKQLVEPALKGTEAAVGAALSSHTVTTIVITSSIAATMSHSSDKGGACFNEHDWNTKSELLGRPDFGGGLDSYRYSKTVAERRFWEMISSKSLNPRRVRAAAILPSFIVGPPRTQRTDGESATFMKEAMEGKVPYRGDTPMCDVRDVALAHIKAALTPGATSDLTSEGDLPQENFRYIISSAKPVRRASALSWLADQYPNFAITQDGSKSQSADSVLPTIFCPTNLGRIGMASPLSERSVTKDSANQLHELFEPRRSLLDMAHTMLTTLKSVSPVRGEGNNAAGVPEKNSL